MSEPLFTPVVTGLRTHNIGRMGLGKQGVREYSFTHPITLVVADNAVCKTTLVTAIQAAICQEDNPRGLRRKKGYLWKGAEEGSAKVTFADGSARAWVIGQGFTDTPSDGGNAPPVLDRLVAGIDHPMLMTATKEIEEFWGRRFRKKQFAPADLEGKAVGYATDKFSMSRAEAIIEQIRLKLETIEIPQDNLDVYKLRQEVDRELSVEVRQFAVTTNAGRGGEKKSATMLDRVAKMRMNHQSQFGDPEEVYAKAATHRERIRDASVPSAADGITMAREEIEEAVTKAQQDVDAKKTSLERLRQETNDHITAEERKIKELDRRLATITIDDISDEKPDIQCPSCQSGLILDGEGGARVWVPLTVDEIANFQEKRELRANMLTEKAGIEQALRATILEAKEEEATLAPLTAILRGHQQSLERLNAAAKEGPRPRMTQEERAAADEFLEHAKRCREWMETIEAAERVALRVAAVECIQYALSPEAGLTGGSGWVDKVNKALNDVGRVSKARLTLPQMDAKTHAFTIDDVDLGVASVAELWHAQAMLQVAMSLFVPSDQETLVILDGADALSTTAARHSLFRLLRKLVDGRQNISVIVTMAGETGIITDQLASANISECGAHFQVQELT